MPSTPMSHRPQTLKQAKKAYRKSGATVRLSASELAIIERRAVLQERADRIKEREARRKANVKKKEERNQREREARQRMRIASPVKEGIHIGPSQLSLGKFMTVGEKRKREDDYAGDVQADKTEMFDTALKGCQNSSLPRTPWRNPLKAVSPNLPTPKTLPIGALKTEPSKAVGSSAPPREMMPPPRIRKTNPPKPTIQQEHRSKSKKPDKSIDDDVDFWIIRGPPRPRMSSATQLTRKISQQKPPNIPPQDRPPDIVDECWDDFFASSTQIARELSPPPVNSVRITPPPPRPPSSPKRQALLPIPPNDEATSLLDQLCTQDLEFSGELTQSLPRTAASPTTDLLAQISTQDLAFSPDLTQKQPPAPAAVAAAKSSSNFDEDLTEEDLEDAVQEFERESTAPAKSRTTTSMVPRPNLINKEKEGPNDSNDHIPKSPTRRSAVIYRDLIQNESKSGACGCDTGMYDIACERHRPARLYEEAYDDALGEEIYEYNYRMEGLDPLGRHEDDSTLDDEDDIYQGDRNDTFGGLGRREGDNTLDDDDDDDDDVHQDDYESIFGDWDDIPPDGSGKQDGLCPLSDPIQEAKLAAEDDAFDLSTQDLRELES